MNCEDLDEYEKLFEDKRYRNLFDNEDYFENYFQATLRNHNSKYFEIFLKNVKCNIEVMLDYHELMLLNYNYFPIDPEDEKETIDLTNRLRGLRGKPPLQVLDYPEEKKKKISVYLNTLRYEIDSGFSINYYLRYNDAVMKLIYEESDLIFVKKMVYIFVLFFY